MQRITLAVAVVCLGACSGKYVRPTTDARIEPTPERLSRGEYLVNNASMCGACHTTRESGDLVDGESTTMYLGGGNILSEHGMSIWIPNITPDEETGVGTWTDDQLMRALRDGVTKDGRFMFPIMPFDQWQHMSDEDARSIVAFLRTVPKVKQPKPRVENKLPFFVSFLVNRGLMMHKPVENVQAPPRDDKVAYGKYVARLGFCADCHNGTTKGPRAEDDALYMAGGGMQHELRIGKLYPRNLTPDPETGLGKYSAEQIKEAIKTGKMLSGRPMLPPMAMMVPHLSGVTDEDLDALVAYLKSLKPAKNLVPEPDLTEEGKKLIQAPVATPVAELPR